MTTAKPLGTATQGNRHGYSIRNERNNVVAEDGHVVAVFNIAVTGTDAIIKIVDHWTLRDGKAISLWAAYFEPQAVLEQLGIKHGLGR